jgi:hypothetical protein
VQGLDAPGGTPAATGTVLPTARAPDASAVALEDAPLLATKLYLPRPRPSWSRGPACSPGSRRGSAAP